MKILTIIISAIISLGTSGGFISDTIVTNIIKSKTENVEQLEVRILNVPNYKVLNGQAQTIKIASRGLEIRENIRIEALEIETDPIKIDLNRINNGDLKDFQQILKQPLQGGIRLVLKEEDLNKTLQSSQIQSYVQKLINNSENPNYEIVNSRLNLLAENRVRIETQVNLLNQNRQETLNITLEVGLEKLQGYRLKIVEPKGTLNGKQLSNKLLQGFADNINKELDFRNLEASGITLRLLQLDINNDQINLAAFVSIANNNILN